MKTYSYSILRYRHDATSGEAVNIGVLVYSLADRFARLELDERYGHLAKLYRGFRADDFDLGLQNLKASLSHLQPQLEKPSMFEEAPHTAAELANLILPDNGGSLRFEGANRGRGSDLDSATQMMFDLWVTEQRPLAERWKRRDEKDVWRLYKQVLELYQIPAVLGEARVKTPSVELKFDHCFRNGKLHALQPLNLQYADAWQIVAHAAQWRGWSSELADVEDFGRLDLLLGAPDKTMPNFGREHEDKLREAEAMLGRMNVNHRIVREEEAIEYAEELADEMREHQVL